MKASILLILSPVLLVRSFTPSKPAFPIQSPTSLHTQSSRASFLATCAAGLTSAALGSSPVLAKDVDPVVKGTKKDPEFEACLSKCMYECTKPKGVEQKSRAECLPECKQTCATNKQQLMLGTPLNKQ